VELNGKGNTVAIPHCMLFPLFIFLLNSFLLNAWVLGHDLQWLLSTLLLNHSSSDGLAV
jgi:hypothetical protein